MLYEVGGKIKSHPSPLHIELIQVDNVNCDRQEPAATADQEQQIEENDQSTSHERALSQPNHATDLCSQTLER